MSKRFFFSFLRLSLLMLAGYYVYHFCKQKTDGFTVLSISSPLVYNPSWETAPLSQQDLETLEKALNQPYSYLASGGQCAAFIAEDKSAVIKFFKHNSRQNPLYLNFLPLPSFLEERRQKQRAEGQEKIERDFSSYKLSFDELKKETALLYVHLSSNKKVDLKPLVIIDKLGSKHTLNLNKMAFVVQQRAELLFPHLEKLIASGDKQGIQDSFSSLVSLLRSRCTRGIFDEDPRIQRNIGMIGNKAVFIDAGRFKRDETRKTPEIYTKDITSILERLKSYLKTKHPDLLPLLDDALTQKLLTLSPTP